MEKKWKCGFLKMRMVSWLIASFLVNSFAFAQDSSLILKNTLSIESNYFTTDRLYNIYTLNSENTIIKYNSTGKRLFEYNNQNYGTPSRVDASNPLRILVYYKEFLTAIILDRTLTELYVFHLQDYEINQSDVAATANDNGLWVFDNWSYQLKKINEQGAIERTSDDLNQLLGIQLEPSQIILKDNQIFLTVPSQGIFVFTLFGQYVKTLPLLAIERFQVQNDYIIFYKNQQLYHYSISFQAEKIINIPKNDKDIQQVNVKNNHIFISTGTEILVYQMKE